MHIDTFLLFLKAAGVGLLIAAPVGPIGLLTIQRTLDRGMATGLATGLGAALADAAYGAVGAWGVTRIIELLTQARTPLALAGGALLLWMAWRTATQPLASRAASVPTSTDLARCFAGTFVLTLSNPATILSFLAVFASMAGSTASTLQPLPMVSGVLVGSAVWWLGLSWGVSRLRHRLDSVWRQRINLLSGCLLAAFALWQWAGLLMPA
jgi:threonine/homoserine/homoserine lactone efflux protein